MLQFFKYVFASCLGVILASVLLTVLSVALVAGLAGSVDKKPQVKANSVLHLTFNEILPERTNNTPVNFTELDPDDVVGLHDMIHCIEHAATNDNIKGILLDISSLSGGQVTRTAIRNAILDFKKESGKFVVSYAPFYSTDAYHMASVADKVYVHPMGGVDFNGFAAFVPFMKDMFDRLGIKWNIFYAGKFKSATEPFRRNNMSDESRQQVEEYLQSMYRNHLDDIAGTRDIASDKLHELAVNYSVQSPQDAVDAGLVDEIGYKGDADQFIRDRIGLDEDDKIRTVSINEYFNAHPRTWKAGASDRIAVVYAEGSIVMGKGELGNIGSEKYVKILKKLRRDDKVKAIVMRINSGGGSALASEDIWHQLKLAKEEGKSVTVSMGDLAASGGYYIAAAGDSIFASPSTLTGSIGVFSMIPNVSEMLDKHIGLYMDTVKTTPFADGLNPFYDLPPAKEAVLQNMTNRIYSVFKQRVADGRDMSLDQVETIAQGRVWTGEKALEIGLVDGLGDVDRAISSAASLAGLTEYRIKEYPYIKPPLQEMLEELFGESPAFADMLMEKKLGKHAKLYKAIEEMSQVEGPQARLPFVILN